MYKASSLFILALLFTLLVCAPHLEAKLILKKVECNALPKMSLAQKKVLLYAYSFGKKRHLGYTLAAIAWHESCAGEFRVNFSDPSAGAYHAYIPVVIKGYSNYQDTAFMRNVVGELLIADMKFASRVALDNLLYWQKVHKNNLKYMIKSYNKGYSWQKDRHKNKMANAYFKSITTKISALQSYMPKLMHEAKKIMKVKEPNKPSVIEFRSYGNGFIYLK